MARMNKTAWAAWERKAMTSTAVSDAVAQIRRRVDAYYAAEITYEEFGTMQRLNWDALKAAGIDRHVAWMLSR